MIARNAITLLSLCAFVLPLRAAPATAPSASPARSLTPDEQLHAIKDKFSETQARIEDLSQRITRETGRSDVSTESLHNAAAKLDQVIFDLELENAGCKARTDALLKEIDVQRMKAEESVRNDVVMDELNKLIDLDLKKYDELSKAQSKSQDADKPNVIHRGDRLQVVIGDITPGHETAKTCDVKEDGSISLPYVGKVSAAGVDEAALEKAIQGTYAQAGVVRNAQVSVTVVARATDALNAAATELAEAKARAAVQREHAISAAGGDLLPTLQKQLVELTISQKERDARLKFARDQRDAIAHGLSAADKLQMLQIEAKRLHAKMDEIEEVMLRYAQ